LGKHCREGPTRESMPCVGNQKARVKCNFGGTLFTPPCLTNRLQRRFLNSALCLGEIIIIGSTVPYPMSRYLDSNILIGTASSRYGGWIGQIYSERRYEKGITRRSHKVGDRTFNEETLAQCIQLRSYLTRECKPPDYAPESSPSI